jgi:NADH-quinone oxidoreductase subunit F
MKKHLEKSNQPILRKSSASFNMALIKTFADFDRIAKNASKQYWNAPLSVRIGMASCGITSGAGDVYNAASEWLDKHKDDFVLNRVGCRGYCTIEPIVELVSPDYHLIFKQMTPESILNLIQAAKENNFSAFMGDGLVWQETRSLKPDGASYISRQGFPGKIPELSSIPFFSSQRKIITRNCGLIDPFNIEQALAREDYFALVETLKLNNPEVVISTILKSGLRGRGGAGFPTGQKWSLARKSQADEKYVFVNADEGNPGAFMDRLLLESDPHAVIEGMAIGAFAIGASKGIIYIRAEYPLAIRIVENAIKQAREYGLLGDNILGTSFSFDVAIRIGAGAFVCGEETALIASAEGKAGEPKPRPPYPAEEGYLSRPTLINNVKTWATVSPIINYGADWFSSIGSEKSKGTAALCITGAIKNTGMIEVPMGISLDDIVFKLGGGAEKKEREIKAIQTGGPLGGCLPRRAFHLPVDYEYLAEAGSMMGSGGMIVVDNTTCMVELAKFFLNFAMDESCGKCTPCREGVRRMYYILDKITAGQGTMDDIALLKDLANYIKDTSLCGLGNAAPNPVLSTLRYFANEYEAHVLQKKCPAGSCVGMNKLSAYPEKIIHSGTRIK